MRWWPRSQGWLRALGCALLLSGCIKIDDADLGVVEQSELSMEMMDGFDPGEQPEDFGVMYSPCATSRHCLPQEYCVHLPNEVGYCSSSCDPEGQLDECDGPPGEHIPACFLVGIADDGPVVCGLDCDALPCPHGMTCQLVHSGQTRRRMCF